MHGGQPAGRRLLHLHFPAVGWILSGSLSDIITCDAALNQPIQTLHCLSSRQDVCVSDDETVKEDPDAEVSVGSPGCSRPKAPPNSYLRVSDGCSVAH